MGDWQAESGFISFDEGGAGGLRSLLVDHGLLSNPSWLLDADPTGHPVDGPAAAALDRLRAHLRRVTERTVYCPLCRVAPPRGLSRWAALAPSLARMGTEERALLQMLGLLPPEDAAPPSPPTCPHAPMRREALEALYRAFPELAFEAGGVLVATPSMTPPRFVLAAPLVRALFSAWLPGPSRPPDAAAGGWGGRARSRAPRRRTMASGRRPRWRRPSRSRRSRSAGPMGSPSPRRARPRRPRAPAEEAEDRREARGAGPRAEARGGEARGEARGAGPGAGDDDLGAARARVHRREGEAAVCRGPDRAHRLRLVSLEGLTRRVTGGRRTWSPSAAASGTAQWRGAVSSRASGRVDQNAT